MWNNINQFKYNCTNELFVRPADFDYMLARWMFSNQIDNFFWSAAQAIEKYMKAILVLNGVSCKGGSHKIFGMFQRLRKEGHWDAPTLIPKPDALHDDQWKGEEYGSFLKRIERMGSPDGRYGLEYIQYQSIDIVKVDHVVWSLRRLTIGLDWVIGRDYSAERLNEFSGRTFRDVINTQINFQPRGPIYEQVEKKPAPLVNMGGSHSDIINEWNLFFRQNNKEFLLKIPEIQACGLGYARNSFLSMFYEQIEIHGSSLLADCGKWLVENVKIDRCSDELIRKEIERIDLERNQIS